MFLLVSSATSAYLAWASMRVFMDTYSEPGQQSGELYLFPNDEVIIEDETSRLSESEDEFLHEGGLMRGVVCMPCLLVDWVLETKEAADKVRYGARIKWRRLCLLLGSASLCVAAWHFIEHCETRRPWDDVNRLIKTVAGKSIVVTREQASVFEPLVESYGHARRQHMLCNVVGAALFTLSAGLDIFGCGSQKLLQVCRLCGFIAMLAYTAGMLAENAPDYVGMLDFKPMLGRCGAKFCASVASSMRTALGAAFLAHSGATYIPLLLSLPWTLDRIGFFLSVDHVGGAHLYTASVDPSRHGGLHLPASCRHSVALCALPAGSQSLSLVGHPHKTHELRMVLPLGLGLLPCPSAGHGFCCNAREHVVDTLSPGPRPLLEGELAKHHRRICPLGRCD